MLTTGCSNCYAREMAKYLEARGIAKYAGRIRSSGTAVSPRRLRTAISRRPFRGRMRT
ncbi:MAG: hypothetical protein JO283_01645 [Bradyrhizobium sp.]|nr:hypothetical protein [Bradyrhizobium sp.]